MGIHQHYADRCWRFRLMRGDWGRALFRTEISWRTNLFLFNIKFKKEDGMIGLTWAVPLLFVHLAVAWPRPWIPKAIWDDKKGRFGGDITIVKFSWYSGGLHWKFWRDDMGWSPTIPKWRDGGINFADLVLGKIKHSERLIEKRDVMIPMPERAYAATVELKEGTWKRPRWFTRKIMRAHIEVPEGLPFPGKGTAAYNCGDDATYGFTGPAKSIPDGVGKIVASVLESRVRYGGWSDWTWKRSPQAAE